MNKNSNKMAIKPRLVVGIGASAGGVEACRDFLSKLPEDSGLTFVIIMHLDPNEESHLAELFQHVTKMKVIQVVKKQPLKPDHVYIIAPSTLLELQNNVLLPRKARKKELHATPRAVDTFFLSLAGDQHSRAVGIILSGAGNDGSDGCYNIKTNNGFVIVQSPETAQYSGMPESAISAGNTDKVLPLEQIPDYLLNYSEDVFADTDNDPTNAFDSILELLEQAYRVSFSAHYKRGTLARRTKRRMGLQNLSDWQAYLEYLQNNPEEVAELYNDLLIGVTQFFRDPEVWKFLEEDIIPRLLNQGTSIRIWVPGCATGEEAYGLAIVFLEQLKRSGGKFSLQIFATDISENALSFARQGLYSSSIQKFIPSDRLSQYFHKEGESFKINPLVREKITFSHHDLLTDPPFTGLDFISCRNVLIYMEPLAQQKIMELFHFALKPNGILLLGSSETVGQSGKLFNAISQKARVFKPLASKMVRYHNIGRFTKGPTSSSEGVGTGTPPQEVQKLDRYIERFVLSQQTNASVAITESFEIRSFYGPTNKYLTPPIGEARMGLIAWARPGLFPRLQTALEHAREKNEGIKLVDLFIERDGKTIPVECNIDPITSLPQKTRMYLVSFKDVSLAPSKGKKTVLKSKNDDVRQLEMELKNTQEELNATFEQLKRCNEEFQTSHEEFLSLNEELQANNEELEASKEELQSLNEELTTVNQQLRSKNKELYDVGNDLNNLLVSTNIPIIFLDQNLCIRRFTPVATALMHLVPADRGRSIEHIKERFRNGNLMEDIRKVQDKLTPAKREVQSEDGRYYLREILPYRTEDNRIDGTCISFHDITTQKDATEQSIQAQLFAEAIVETSLSALLVLKPDMRIMSVNNTFCETFQVSKSDSEGKVLYEIGNEQWNLPKLRNLLEEVLPKKKEVRNFEVEHFFKEIGKRTMRLNARQVRLVNRPLILLAIEDITEQKNSEETLRQYGRKLSMEHERKDQFLAILSHEIRNPLSGLLNGIDLLDLVHSDADRMKKIRDMMRRQAKRIFLILDELLEMSRITAGKVQISKKPVDITDVVQSAAEAIGPLLDAREHELTLSLPPRGQVFVRGDLQRLTQVVENLLSNAVKYTEDRGKIQLAIDSDKNKVELRVKDNGIGINPDFIPYVFESFTQEPRARGQSGGGLGIGLALIKSLVEAHNGKVEASSAGPGKGSEFIVTLPRANSGDTYDEESQIKVIPHRVLIVDDEREVADTLETVLKEVGHDVQAVYHGADVLKAIDSFQPQVVLLDLGMPEMDGYQIAKLIRKEHTKDQIKVIALTGQEMNEKKLKKAGFDHYLKKPAEIKSVLALINEADPKK